MYILIKNLTATKFTKEVLKEHASGNKRIFLNDTSTEFVVEFNEKTSNVKKIKELLSYIGGIEFTDKLDFFTSRALILLNEEFEIENKKEIEEWNPSVLIGG